MLRNHRPNMLDIDYQNGRYVAAVNSEISYGSGDVKLDRADMGFYQNILANGGICGRRAFFGRFLLRAFGIPAIARPQPGHATLAHWTPNGWQTRLGGNWGGRSRMEVEGKNTHNINFLEITQARESAQGFMQVKRAQWIGHAMGEAWVAGLHGWGGEKGKPGLEEDIRPWHAIALIKQSQVIEQLKDQALAAGKVFGEASSFNNYIDPPAYTPTAGDLEVSVDASGAIILPAAASKMPDPNLAKSGEMGVHTALRIMESKLGGAQLHYGRYTPGLKFSLTFNLEEAGEYLLSTRLVTVRPEEKLNISVNGAPGIENPLPYTVGMWGESEPIKVTLRKGENTIAISRSWDSAKGLSFKDFKLSPVR